MQAAFLFVDGLGVGLEDERYNPCTQDRTGIFQVYQNSETTEVPFAGIALGIDATLGVPGLPQSATGQTALLTGVNAAQLIGRHLSGFPNQLLREVLLQKSILLQITRLQKRAAFINAFRPLFFDLPEAMILRLSATTIANYAAKLPFFQIENIAARRAIYQDFTNVSLLQRGFEVPIFSPEEAAEILATSLHEYDFVLYEYFLTDRAGHTQDMKIAKVEIQKLGRFVFHFLQRIDLTNTCIILSSDHGNIEDLSTRSHTRNPAMTIVWGPGRNEIVRSLLSLTDITPAILRQLKTTPINS